MTTLAVNGPVTSQPQIPSTPSHNTSSTANNTQKSAASVSYILGVDGQGVGDECDHLTFTNPDSRDDFSSIKYGSVISIKSFAAKER